MTVKAWFIDTNVVVPWILVRGGLLKYFSEKYNLAPDYESKYIKTHESSLKFISQISEERYQNDNEFFISNLVSSEVFSAIRTELLPFVMYDNNISMGDFGRKNQYNHFSNEDAVYISNCVHESIGNLMDSGLLYFNDYFQIDEEEVEDNSRYIASQTAYWNTFHFLLLNVAGTNTQDGILLGTAIANEAHYFVTDDKRLIKAAKQHFQEKGQIQIIKPSNAVVELKKGIGKIRLTQKQQRKGKT